MAARKLVPFAFGLLAFVSSQSAEFRQASDQHRPLRDAVLGFTVATDWQHVGRRLGTTRLQDMDQIDLLLHSVRWLDPEAFSRVTSSVSLEDLDRVTAGHWHDLGRISHVVATLDQGENREPARSWVYRAHRRDQVDPHPNHRTCAPCRDCSHWERQDC